MPDRAYLSVFTPSRTPPEDLEAILVQRHEILKDALERVQESATTGNKHHMLFIGPRGTGKTNLVTLLVHRINKQAALNENLRIAWLNEDETSTNLLELFRRIYLALSKKYPDEYNAQDMEPMFDFSAGEAEKWLAKLLVKSLQNRTLLVVVENLDALFQGMGKEGQQRLRAFIQENPILSIVATAQRLVTDISKRDSAFFGFFQIEYLKPLSVDDAAELLSNISELNGQHDVTEFILSATGRARIRALHHLSGGNHRIYIVLSQFITRKSMDQLVEPFSKMIDEMTPYYQERIRWLPAQQRKIVELLCMSERPVPVKAMARQLFASHQTISSQLKDLKEKGYVQASQRGRESLYEIAEPLMRLCVEVKENQSYGPLRMLVDFLRVWYSGSELNHRLNQCSGEGTAYSYLVSAIERNSQDGNLRAKLLVDGFLAELTGENVEEWGDKLTFYAQESEELALACGEWAKGDTEKALKTLAEIESDERGYSDEVKASAWLMSGDIYERGSQLELAIAHYSSVLNLEGIVSEKIHLALISRGALYSCISEQDESIADLSKVIGAKESSAFYLIQSLVFRGMAYFKIKNYKKSIADFISIIDMPNTETYFLKHHVLIWRARAYKAEGFTKKAISDLSSAIDLPDIDSKHLAEALVERGEAYKYVNNNKKALADFDSIIGMEGVPYEITADVLNYRALEYIGLGEFSKSERDYMAACELLRNIDDEKYIEFYCVLTATQILADSWDKAVSNITNILVEANKKDLVSNINFAVFIVAIFQGGISYVSKNKRIRELLSIFQHHAVLPKVGEDLIAYLGDIYTDSKDNLETDRLENWASAWEAAGSNMQELKLPLRIFRTGIDFIKSGGEDRSILLDLNQEERKILEQVFDL